MDVAVRMFLLAVSTWMFASFPTPPVEDPLDISAFQMTLLLFHETLFDRHKTSRVMVVVMLKVRVVGQTFVSRESERRRRRSCLSTTK